MKLHDAYQYFGSKYKLCKILGVHRSMQTHWDKWGYIPFHHQERLEKITNAELKADKKDIEEAKMKKKEEKEEYLQYLKSRSVKTN